MRLALAVAAALAIGGCGRTSCCPRPARAAPATTGSVAATLPAGALEATLLYGRASGAPREDPDAARQDLGDALSLVGDQRGPERLDTFRARIRARLTAPRAGPATATSPGLQVQIHDVTDLVGVLARLPSPRLDRLRADGARPEPAARLLVEWVLEYAPPRRSGEPPTQVLPQGGQAPPEDFWAPSSGPGASDLGGTSGPPRHHLVVKAVGEQQDAIAALLSAWREVWPLLWPAALQ